MRELIRAGHARDAFVIYGHLKSAGVPLTSATYVTLFEACESSGDVAAAAALERRMAKECVRFTDGIRLAMMRAMATTKNAAGVRAILDSIEQPDAGALVIAARAFAAAGAVDEVVDIVGWLRRDQIISGPEWTECLCALVVACGADVAKVRKLLGSVTGGSGLTLPVYKAVVGAYALAKRPEGAFTVLKELDARGIVPTAEFLAAVISACGSDVDQAAIVAWFMAQARVPHDGHTLRELVRVCARAGQMHLAESLMQVSTPARAPRSPSSSRAPAPKEGKPDAATLERLQIDIPSLGSRALAGYRALILAHGAAGRHERALEVFRAIKVPRDSETLEALIAACSDSPVVEQAIEDAWAAARKVYPPQKPRYVSAFETPVVQKAWKTTQAAAATKKAPLDRMLACAVIMACGRAGLLLKASRFVDELVGAKLKPTLTTMHALAEAMSKTGSLERLPWMLTNLKTAGLLSLDCLNMIYPLLLKAAGVTLAQDDDRELVPRAIFMFRKETALGHPVEQCFFSSAIESFCASGLVLKAFELMRSMAELGLVPGTKTVDIVVRECGRKEELDLLQRTLALLEDAGGSIDQRGFNTIVDIFGKAGELDKAFDAVSKMTAAGCAPDVFTFTSLLDACSKRGDSARVDQTLAMMRAAGVKPNLHTYTVMVSMCGSPSMSIDQLEGLLAEMSRNGFEPELETYSAAIARYAEFGMVEKAFETYARMEACNIRPNKVTCSALAKAASKVGDLKKALSVLDIMEKHQVRPHLFVYTTLIGASCRAGEIEKAVELVHAMKRDNVRPSWMTLEILSKNNLKHLVDELPEIAEDDDEVRDEKGNE